MLGHHHGRRPCARPSDRPVYYLANYVGGRFRDRRRRPGDRRAWEVTITAKGRRALARARRLARTVEDEVLGGLSAPERSELLALLRRALVAAPPAVAHSPTDPVGGDEVLSQINRRLGLLEDCVYKQGRVIKRAIEIAASYLQSERQ